MSPKTEKSRLLSRLPAEPETENAQVQADLRSKSLLGRLWGTISLAHLITESNQKAYVQPVVLFAMLSTASGGVTSNPNPSWKDIAMCFPRVLLYIWLYVLYFDCSNQKDPEAVKEDKINKPWRAIPSGRLSIEGAERWYIAACCLLLAVSGLWLGGFPEAVAFMIETWTYDYARGADFWWSKNIINSLFYATGQLGATRVAAESMTDTTMVRAGYEWCGILALEILTTIQIQDIKDEEGDNARGRRTMPIVIGQKPTRWLTSLTIGFWSVACPLYWATGSLHAGFILPLFIGAVVTIRTLFCTSVPADRITWNIYTLLWLPALYATPLLSRFDLLSFY
ncbi:prenyltransferase [Diaporthe amygdali]|uniref:prenyltransferase n=1 Tax=Phomopsis amygdali TaxID=1214568 RepID=UPI0022FEC26E|nr:prenyltransferase [Diaporthe amygdali]KAJ0119925.1 prenyltransferase [Diaporthe amygdali]